MAQLRKLWLCMTAAYVGLLPSFYLFYSEYNRLALGWSREMHGAILTAIGVLGLFYYAGYWVVYRLLRIRGWGKWFANVIFLSVLVFIVIQTCVTLLSSGEILPGGLQAVLDRSWLKILYLVVLPVTLVIALRHRARSIITNIYMALSVMLVLAVILPLSYPIYREDLKPLTEAIERRPQTEGLSAPNVYIFLFDKFSYDRMFSHGQLRSDLPNFKNLLETSTCYHNAYSPGTISELSIPRFLYQCDKDFMELDNKNLKRIVRHRMEVDGRSIFSDSGKSWFTVVVGYYIDYAKLMGHQVDCAITVFSEVDPVARNWRSYPAEVTALLKTKLEWLRFFGIEWEQSVLTMSHVASFIKSQTEIPQLAVRIIKEVNWPTFAFIHMGLPHAPFVWDAEGMKKHVLVSDIWQDTEQNYMGNVRYADVIMGELISALKSSAKFDRSLIIVLSDHSWYDDPKQPGYDPVLEKAGPFEINKYKHVPLIIKLPFQHEAKDVLKRINTAQLYPIIHDTLETYPRAP